MWSTYVRACDGIKDFAIYDLKGKGATDMWLAGVPLEQIQALCGHEFITTTVIYVISYLNSGNTAPILTWRRMLISARLRRTLGSSKGFSTSTCGMLMPNHASQLTRMKPRAGGRERWAA